MARPVPRSGRAADAVRAEWTTDTPWPESPPLPATSVICWLSADVARLRTLVILSGAECHPRPDYTRELTVLCLIRLATTTPCSACAGTPRVRRSSAHTG